MTPQEHIEHNAAVERILARDKKLVALGANTEQDPAAANEDIDPMHWDAIAEDENRCFSPPSN